MVQEVVCIILRIGTSRGGRNSRAQALRAKSWEFDSWSSQINDLLNWYLSVPGLVLSINRIGQLSVRIMWLCRILGHGSIERRLSVRKVGNLILSRVKIPGCVKPITYKIDSCPPHLVLGITRIGQGLVSQCQDNDKSGHGIGGMVSQWSSIIKVIVYIVPRNYPSWYDLRFGQNVKPQQTAGCHKASIASQHWRFYLISTVQIGWLNE